MAQTPEQKRAKRAQYMREWTARNRERAREIARASRARNRESLLERKREYYARNREQVLESQREYVARNRGTRNAQKREHWARNRDEINEERRAQRAADLEGTRAKSRDRYWRDRERINELARARNAHNRDRRFVAWLWRQHRLRPEGWALLWEVQDGRCYLCGEVMDPSGNVVIEHDHSCCPNGKSCEVCRRGMAHGECNVAIGMAGDSPGKLRHMADALEAAQLVVEQRKAVASQQDSLFPELDAEACA